MKLLIVTQKVDKNDSILGFFHRWIEEFAKHFEVVNVICLQEGKHELPENVNVYSLGKEKSVSRFGYIVNFYKLILRLRNEYDVVFVHMNPEYLVLGGLVWKILGKKISLWYVHRQVNLKLRIAEMLANDVYTSSKESFGIKSAKVHYIGHGIDRERFENIVPAQYLLLNIFHLGRVTRIKNIEIIIQALKILVDRDIDAILHVAGEPVTGDDRTYKAELQKSVDDLGLGERVIWKGNMDNRKAFSEASVTINAAPDGGMDKAVLESLAANRMAFVANRAFSNLYGDYSSRFLFPFGDSLALANKITDFLKKEDRGNTVLFLSQKVRNEYDVATLLKNIANNFHG